MTFTQPHAESGTSPPSDSLIQAEALFAKTLCDHAMAYRIDPFDPSVQAMEVEIVQQADALGLDSEMVHVMQLAAADHAHEQMVGGSAFPYNDAGMRMVHGDDVTAVESEMAMPITLSDNEDPYEILDFDNFISSDYQMEYLVDGVLVEGQPAIICGPSKSLKTNNSIALSVALASGTKFLDTYKVSRKCKVLFMSAESGKSAIQSSVKRIMSAYRINPKQMSGQWFLADWVPHAKIEERYDQFKAAIARHKPDVVFIDPVYQATDGEDSANVQKMGQQFSHLADAALSQDCTPVFVHHTKKNAESVTMNRPLELRDMQGAGVSEYFRQWLLINRRSRYELSLIHI